MAATRWTHRRLLRHPAVWYTRWRDCARGAEGRGGELLPRAPDDRGRAVRGGRLPRLEASCSSWPAAWSRPLRAHRPTPTRAVCRLPGPPSLCHGARADAVAVSSQLGRYAGRPRGRRCRRRAEIAPSVGVPCARRCRRRNRRPTGGVGGLLESLRPGRPRVDEWPSARQAVGLQLERAAVDDRVVNHRRAEGCGRTRGRARSHGEVTRRSPEAADSPEPRSTLRTGGANRWPT